MTLTTKPVALITGASSGMGKDFALRLISEGYAVYGAARRTDLMQPILSAGGVTLELDVTADASMVSAVDRIVRERGRIDVLINCAGYGQMGAIEDVAMDDARRQMEVNLFGLARLTQLVLPHMRAARTGKIVNISSVGGKFATPLAGWYHASKFALEGYSDALRMEVEPFGVEVVVVEPGGTDSEWIPIAIEQLQRVSARGPYRNLVEGIVQSSVWKRKMPSPSIVTDLVVKALKARRPQTRYVAGFTAKLSLQLRHLLSDRIFDRLMMSAVKKA
jgi:NAD(P)-dependent dehydrogenase (short-subunit alcohol dehydrogenase family)